MTNSRELPSREIDKSSVEKLLGIAGTPHIFIDPFKIGVQRFIGIKSKTTEQNTEPYNKEFFKKYFCSLTDLMSKNLKEKGVEDPLLLEENSDAIGKIKTRIEVIFNSFLETGEVERVERGQKLGLQIFEILDDRLSDAEIEVLQQISLGIGIGNDPMLFNITNELSDYFYKKYGGKNRTRERPGGGREIKDDFLITLLAFPIEEYDSDLNRG